MIIAIGSDHAGYKVKEKIKEYLEKDNIIYKDLGTYSEESCDYPIFAENVADSVSARESDYGILVCGSGIGMSIAANKVKGVRAALCYEPHLAEMSRMHNNANILCLGARITSFEMILETLNVFLNTKFEGGRHQKRIDKIDKMEFNYNKEDNENGRKL